MGPPPFHDGFPFGDPQAAIDATVNSAHEDPYQQSKEFEEWQSQERNEEGEDEDADENNDDDEDGLHEHREQRDENDNRWYDEDQRSYMGRALYIYIRREGRSVETGLS